MNAQLLTILDDIQTRFQYIWLNYDGKRSRKASQIEKHKYSSHSQEVKTQSAGWFWFHPLTGITVLSLNPPFVFHGWIKHGCLVSCQSLPWHQGKAKLGGNFCSTTLLTRVNYAINMCLLPPVREHRISRRHPAATTACPYITHWFCSFVLGPPTYLEGPAIVLDGEDGLMILWFPILLSAGPRWTPNKTKQ